MQLSNQEILSVAIVAHEVNKAYCESIGDRSQQAWADADLWQKDSVIDGVVFMAENLHSTPEENHNNWLKKKQADGWTYGEAKDPEAKTHPCMLPFAELPQDQKAKNHIFQAIVRTFIGLANYRYDVPLVPEAPAASEDTPDPATD